MKRIVLLAILALGGTPVFGQTSGLLVFHLDFNSFQFRKETVSRILRRIAQDGYNAVLWEVENKVKWESCPEVVSTDAFTKDDFRSLLDEAKRLGLEPIPLMQTFGHAEYVLGCAKYRCLRECPDRKNCYCPSNPESRRFLKNLLHEYLDLFGGDVKRFHLGGDEARGYGTCSACKSRDAVELYVEHLESVSEELLRREVRPIVWHDMLQHFDGTCQSFARLPKRYSLWYWEYFPAGKCLYWNEQAEQALRHEVAAGREVVFCASSQCYLDDPFLVKYGMHRTNIAESIESCHRCGLSGFCLTSWSCHAGSKTLQFPLIDFAALEFRNPSAEANWRTVVTRNFGSVQVATLDALTDWDNALGDIDGRYGGQYKDAKLPPQDLIERKGASETSRTNYQARAQAVADRVERALSEIRAANGALTPLAELAVRAGELKADYHNSQTRRLTGQSGEGLSFGRVKAFYEQEQSSVSAERSARRVCDPVAYSPEEWNLVARKRFAEQRFGIFIHWGLYANYAQGEWYLYQGKLREKDYSRMMHGFCPSRFNAREWVRVFKDAGAKYVTITSRHHDGFSLWPTKVDDGYNIANTPFGRDILGELAAACREKGLQLNFYYSLMDWHRKDYPAGDDASIVLGPQKGNYESYKDFMLKQIGELIDWYRPGNIWFDGEWEHARHGSDGLWSRTLDWDFDAIYDFIHARKTLVANNNHQPIRPKEDIQLFERDLPGDNSGAGFSAHQPVTQDRPVEQCDVIQENVWGYRIGERKFRTASDVIAMLARAAAKDSNLLMNIGPDGSGALPEEAVGVMSSVGLWMRKNGESIYGTSAGGVGLGKDVVSTRKDGVLYLHFLNPDVDKFAFGLNGRVSSVRCLEEKAEVTVERTSGGDAVVTVVRPSGYLQDLVVRIAAEQSDGMN